MHTQAGTYPTLQPYSSWKAPRSLLFPTDVQPPRLFSVYERTPLEKTTKTSHQQKTIPAETAARPGRLPILFDPALANLFSKVNAFGKTPAI